MTGSALRFSLDTSTEADIFAHLDACDRHFSPALSLRVDLRAYARKLRDSGVTVEGWDGGRLVALVAGYLNPRGKSSYISNVSVSPAFAGKSVATRLLRAFVDHASAGGMETVALEVSKTNPAALHLFSKFGFRPIEDRGELLLMQASLSPREVLREPMA